MRVTTSALKISVKRRVSPTSIAASSPQPAITDNIWYPALLAAGIFFACGIFLLSGMEKKLTIILTRGT
ncbi:hypothetical protein J8V57_13350 [Xenorhabdus sp. PB61.4]|uniref:hypothetical protein n=1 Tax=Xenorhabdus sp. PB61.4 TaxID=2788940 RepID=UPI001E63C691|nr:hypothetical protein [Xenorhabdus sp. PB61.4]MCC8367243.1 hypothetical protein [Xenorhabdus sp. PB61.4]